MKLRTVIVDDEAPNRNLLRRLLAKNPQFEIAGECADGLSAVDTINTVAPDLVLLDVQMPELNGFEVLQRVEPDRMPDVIFITAHDTFALLAFKARAFDYLLKPFEESRFHEALDRVAACRAGKRSGQLKESLAEFVNGLAGPPKFLHRLMVKTASAVRFLKTDEIDWVESSGNYLVLHVGGEKFHLRGRLTELERKLDPERFFRIHRSALVNLDRVKEFRPMGKGDGTVVLKSGVCVTASRSGGQQLQEFLGTAL
ncbi:MAG TPA: LytTR family DNA-binding domain-containing protein [Opitutaceae bacterium]|jgi:two-component system LytT family response regulator